MIARLIFLKPSPKFLKTSSLVNSIFSILFFKVEKNGIRVYGLTTYVSPCDIAISTVDLPCTLVFLLAKNCFMVKKSAGNEKIGQANIIQKFYLQINCIFS